jgi:hypothetical protein
MFTKSLPPIELLVSDKLRATPRRDEAGEVATIKGPSDAVFSETRGYYP